MTALEKAYAAVPLQAIARCGITVRGVKYVKTEKGFTSLTADSVAFDGREIGDLLIRWERSWLGVYWDQNGVYYARSFELKMLDNGTVKLVAGN